MFVLYIFLGMYYSAASITQQVNYLEKKAFKDDLRKTNMDENVMAITGTTGNVYKK